MVGLSVTLPPLGLYDLCRVDPRFQSFSKSLFNRALLSVDRDQQTAEDNKQLDETIEHFLLLLSSHFLSPAAFKVLEYLIRRFR